MSNANDTQNNNGVDDFDLADAIDAADAYEVDMDDMDDDAFLMSVMESTLALDTLNESKAINDSHDKWFFGTVHAQMYAQAAMVLVHEPSVDDTEMIYVLNDLAADVYATTQRLWWNKCSRYTVVAGDRFVTLDHNDASRRNTALFAQAFLGEIRERVPEAILNGELDGDADGDTWYTVTQDLETYFKSGETAVAKGTRVNVSKSLREYVMYLYESLDEALNEYMYS